MEWQIINRLQAANESSEKILKQQERLMDAFNRNSAVLERAVSGIEELVKEMRLLRKELSPQKLDK